MIVPSFALTVALPSFCLVRWAVTAVKGSSGFFFFG